MFWNKGKPKPKERFYLFPGQGGRSLRAKRKVHLIWALFVGALFSFLFIVIIYWWNERRIR